MKRMLIKSISFFTILASFALPQTKKLVLKAPWGREIGAFGKEDVAARLGPCSIKAYHGKIYILDRINARIEIFSYKGKYIDTIDIGSKTVDLIALDGESKIIVLDAFVKKQIRVFKNKSLFAMISVPWNKENKLLPTGIFAGKDSILVEFRHSFVKAYPCKGIKPLMNYKVYPTYHLPLPGRPTVFGWVQAARIKSGFSIFIGKEKKEGAKEYAFLVKNGVECILDLETDRFGRIFTFLFPWDDPMRRILALVIDRNGNILNKAMIDDGTITDMLNRFCVTPEGRLFHLRTNEEGVEVVEWFWKAWPSPKEVEEERSERKGGQK